MARRSCSRASLGRCRQILSDRMNEISPDEKQDEISRIRSVRMKHQMITRMTNQMRSVPAQGGASGDTCQAAAAAAAAAGCAWAGAATAGWPPPDRQGAPFKAPDEISPNEITPDEKQDEISRMRSVRMKHRMRSRG